MVLRQYLMSLITPSLIYNLISTNTMPQSFSSQQSNNLSQPPPLLLIDASIYIFQYYFSLPDNWFSEKESNPTAAVYGYTAFLLRLIKAQQPRRVAACFDESLDQCFRNEIYPDYKVSRALPDELLAFQLHACREVTELLGIACFSSQRYEADDLIGSLYRQCRKQQASIAILTRDKDLGQLLQRPQDFLWDYSKYEKQTKTAVASEYLPKAIAGRSYSPDIVEKFGIEPSQMVDYLALVGDSIDDIPGVPGIGAKTAQQLLQYFGSITQLMQSLKNAESALTHIPIRGAKRIADNLISHQQQITMAQKLATIVTDLKLITSVNELNVTPVDQDRWVEFCHRMGFPKLAVRL